MNSVIIAKKVIKHNGHDAVDTNDILFEISMEDIKAVHYVKNNLYIFQYSEDSTIEPTAYEIATEDELLAEWCMKEIKHGQKMMEQGKNIQSVLIQSKQ